MKKRRYKYLLLLLLILPIIFISSCGKSKKINNNTDVDTTTISTKDTSTSSNQNISTSADDTSTTTQTSVDITTSVDTTTSISTTTETGPIDFQINYYFESLNSPYNTKLYDLYTTENKNGIISEYDDFNSYDGLRRVNIERNETSIDVYYDRSYAILKVMSNNTSFGTVDKLDIYGNRSMKYQEVAHLKALPNLGYEFENWYVNNSFYSDQSEIDFEMPNYNVTIYANFKYGEFEVIVENETGYEIQGLEETYAYNDPINLSLVDLPYSYNVIWTFGEEEITSPELHTQMPNNDLYLKVEIIPCRKIENTQYVYFGSYPQTVLDSEEDASLIASLNSKAGTIPTESNNYKWKHYASYYGTNTIWYQDITHNGKKYRGVYFTKNRGSSLTEGYEVNTVYWFSFDPIKWEIFTDEDNKKLLTTDLVLDYMQYASWTNGKVDDGEPYYHNGKTTYACDYECSDVRKWLTEVFYNDAFNDFEKEIINTSYILNQNKYNDYSESTIDKVFLLRQVDLEAKYGVNNFELIRRLGTNYTNCLGGENYTNSYANPPWTKCYYWTRQSCSSPDSVCLDNATTKTNYKNGIRPSLWINLDLLNIDDERPTTLNQDGYIDGNHISNQHILECYVSGTFSISGKGTVATVQKINNDALTSGFVRGILRVGDTVYLYTPEGDEYELTVEGLEMFNKMVTEAFNGDSVGILFGDSISKDQITIGSLITNVKLNKDDFYKTFYVKALRVPQSNGDIEPNQAVTVIFGGNYLYGKIDNIHTMNYAYVSSIPVYSEDIDNYYILQIAINNAYPIVLGNKAEISVDSKRAFTSEFIGFTLNDVYDYLIKNNYPSNTAPITFNLNRPDLSKTITEGRTGQTTTYVKYYTNDYFKLSFDNDAKISEIINLACPYNYQGYTFKEWVFKVGDNQYQSLDLLKDYKISDYYSSISQLYATWEAVSFVGLTLTKEEDEQLTKVSCFIKNADVELGDSIKIQLDDGTIYETEIISIINENGVELTETDISQSNEYTFILDIDYDHIKTYCVIYK